MPARCGWPRRPRQRRPALSVHPVGSSSREWLRVVVAAIAIVLICAVWTFWN
jgi:hypothetical protein